MLSHREIGAMTATTRRGGNHDRSRVAAAAIATVADVNGYETHDDFVEALLAAPLGLTLLAELQLGTLDAPIDVPDDLIAADPEPAAVVAAAQRVRAMTLDELLTIVLRLMVTYGPWNPPAPRFVAHAYRYADARRSIAEAVAARFGTALHRPIDLDLQQWWWTFGGDRSWEVEMAPLFVDFANVYETGQFTWAGLRTVTDPPPAIERDLAAVWELECPPVRRCWLPVRPDARVVEIHRPGDWVRLVAEHPRVGGTYDGMELPGPNQDRRAAGRLYTASAGRAARVDIRHQLAPDWRSVAEQYDGVHLSWAGLLTTDGFISDLGDGDVTMLRYWFSERTLWLADVFGEPRLAPSVDLGVDEHAPWLDVPTGGERVGLGTSPVTVLSRLLGRSARETEVGGRA